MRHETNNGCGGLEPIINKRQVPPTCFDFLIFSAKMGGMMNTRIAQALVFVVLVALAVVVIFSRTASPEDTALPYADEADAQTTPLTNPALPYTDETDFQVERTKDGKGIVIAHYTGKAAEVRIPASIQGLPVREIGERAFRGYRDPTYTDRTLFVPTVANIVFPETVKTIGNHAFYGCTTLTNITFPAKFPKGEGLTHIENYVFMGCTGLTTITLPASIMKLGHSSFAGCHSLATVIIPDEVKKIEFVERTDGIDLGSFEHTRLTPASQAALKARGWNGYPASAIFTDDFWAKRTEDGKGVFITRYIGKAAEVRIPATIQGLSVQIIGYEAFYRNTSLVSVAFPEGLWAISGYAFMNCTGLTNIAFNEGLTHIGIAAFGGCTGLTAITLPASIQMLAYESFGYCVSLTTVLIPDTVKKIEFEYSVGDAHSPSSPFTDCESLSPASQAALKARGWAGF